MATKLKPLKDQVIVVCGDATGIGIAAARAAAGKGARVLLIAAEQTSIGEAVRAINNAGGRADYVVAPVADADAVAAAAQAAVKRFGRVDGWINDGDEAGVASGCTAAVALLDRGGGALISLEGAAGGAIAAQVDAMRADIRKRAPRVAVCVIALPAGAVVHLEPAVDTVLDVLVHPRPSITVGEPAPRSLVARLADRPGTVAAVGLSGLALAVGALVWRRRGQRDA